MMGFKERTFALLVAVSLEELVPQDHLYRHVQKVLDLSFVYDLVRECYSLAGRPSIDPVVFWHRCNWSCSLTALCDAQIAYREWGTKALPQVRVQACHQFLHAFPVTGGCEARSNA